MKRRVEVKICGITTSEDGLMAVRAGADAIGLVFWPESPRAVSVDAAREISLSLPPLVTRVGVFVDASLAYMREVAESVGLDVIQLHGDEPLSILDELPRRALKALRVGSTFDESLAIEAAQRAAGILLDSRVPGLPGGTGETFDWGVARRLRGAVDHLVLAGGLRPDNVEAAIREVGPDAVDVSTGAESAPGKKDREKLTSFFAAVESAQAEAVR